MSICDRVSIVMRDVDVGRAGGDARERADVDSAGSVARDEYVTFGLVCLFFYYLL